MNKLMHAAEQEARIRNARIDAWFDRHFPCDEISRAGVILTMRADLKRLLSEPINSKETL